MPTVLVVTVDLGGNVPPVLGLAAELAPAATASCCTPTRPFGAAPPPPAASSCSPREPTTTRCWRGARSARCGRSPASSRTAGAAVTSSTAARTLGADVVLVDALLTGTAAEVEAAGLRTVLLGHTTWEYLAPQLGRGPRHRRAPAPRRRADAGARARRPAPPAHRRRLDPADPLPANAVRVGAVLQEPVARRRRHDAADRAREPQLHLVPADAGGPAAGARRTRRRCPCGSRSRPAGTIAPSELRAPANASCRSTRTMRRCSRAPRRWSVTAAMRRPCGRWPTACRCSCCRCIRCSTSR